VDLELESQSEHDEDYSKKLESAFIELETSLCQASVTHYFVPCEESLRLSLSEGSQSVGTKIDKFLVLSHEEKNDPWDPKNTTDKEPIIDHTNSIIMASEEFMILTIRSRSDS